VEHLVHHGGGGFTGLVGPAHHPLRRPIQMALVGLGHVRCNGVILPRGKAPQVAGDALAPMQEFDTAFGDTGIQ
jgi:hypothetical protein